MPGTLKPVSIPDRTFTTWLERLLLGLVVVLLGVTGWLVVNSIQARERGYVNRATACRVQLLLGAELDEGCLTPAVVEHYNPDEHPTTGVNSEGQRVNRELLCALARAQGVASTHCEP